MHEERSFDSKEVQQILEEASREESAEKRSTNLSFDEVREAAKAAGISDERLEQAARSVETKRTTRLGTIVAALVILLASLGLIFWAPLGLEGWRRHSLSLFNEHRSLPVEIEIWLPSKSVVSRCEDAPSLRASEEQYELWRRIELQPRGRIELDVPQRPPSCPQAWIRSNLGGVNPSTAIFELPVSVEVERRGSLDQQGAGHPQMSPPPMKAIARSEAP